MTLLAQKRTGGCQQHFMVGAMWRMAIQAAILDRGMTENKRTTLFSMTLKTNFIDRILFQEGIRRTAMWIMAVTASHLTLKQRHMRTLAKFYALLLMASKTGVMNRFFV